MAEQVQDIQDITAVDNMINTTPGPKPGVQKYDWFKNDLAGLNNNMADVFSAGYSPEDHVMDEMSAYWKNPAMRQPFEQKFGDQAEAKFKEVYDMSKQRFQNYKDMKVDLSSTSGHTFIAPGKIERNLEKLGYGNIDRSKAVEVNNPIRDPWGAEMIYRTSAHAVFTPPKHSIRQGAEMNGVMDSNGKLIPLEQYLEDNPGTNLVYAMDEKGAPKLQNGLNYLRPLAYGEERAPWEEIYGGKLNTYFGMNGIETPDGYWWKFTGKNLFNFTADVLDSGTEFLKMLDNLWQEGDQSAWDRSLTEFQNDTNAALFVPTSEQGMQKWYSTEGLVDGVTQVVGQLAGMMAVGRTVTGLGNIAKIANGSMKLGEAFSGMSRAGSVASRLWMASLASDDFAKEARRMGFSPREQQLFYSLYMLGMYKIAGLSEMAINPVKDKVVQANIFKTILSDLNATKQATGKLTPSGIWQSVKNAQNSLKMALATESGLAGYMASGSTEAAEEVSELLFDKAFKEGVNNIYNPMSSKIFGDTRRDVRFNVNWEDLPTEVAQSATLGFAGGMIARKIIKQQALNPTTLLGYGAVEGGYDKLDRMWDKMYNKGQIVPGGKNIDVLGNEITDPERHTESREYMVYKAIKNEIAGARALWDGMKLRNAFTSTEEALKFVNDSNIIKQTSIGADIASRLSEMTSLQADINTAKITEPEDVKKATSKIEQIKQELEDMKAGKYAAHYLKEGLFNMYSHKLRDSQLSEGFKMISFNRFQTLEGSLSSYMKQVTDMNAANPLSLEEVLSRKPTITQDKYREMVAKAAEKYEITFNEDGETEGTPENIKKFTDERVMLDELVYADPPVPMSHFMRIANTDGSSGKKFSELVEGEIIRSSDESNVYDDVQSLTNIQEGIYERLSQLEAIANVNETFNMLAEKGNFSERASVIEEKERKDIATELIKNLGPVTALMKVAVENKKSFFNSSLKAWDGQVQEMAARMSKIGDLLTDAGLPEFADLKPKLDPILINIANEESNSDERLKYIFQAEEVIHNHFAASPKEALTRLWNVIGMDSENTALRQFSHAGNYMYLKAMINMDPKIFRDSYLTALNSAKENKLTPFPEQYFSIFLTTASLMGGYNPIADAKYNSEITTLTESVFVNGDQGSGKTLVAAIALRTAQIMRGGGDVLVVAKQNELRLKNAEFLKKFDVKMDPSRPRAMEFEQIMDFLNSDDAKSTSLIYIDEVTMFDRDHLAEIDKRLAEINAKVQDPTKTIKLLLTGDTRQATVMNKEGTESHSIDTRTVVDRTPRTRFSFRTGNEDILAYLKHLNNLFDTFNTTLRPPTVSFNYDSKTMSGVRVTDDIDKVLADMMKKKEIASKDFVVITTPERAAEIRKKYDKSLGDNQILTPMQAQGRQWKYVLVDLPIDLTPSATNNTENIERMLRDMISASGRAMNMLVVRNQSPLGVLTGEGKSDIKEASFTDEQFDKIREKHAATLVQAGVSEVNIQTEPVVREIVKSTRTEQAFIYNTPLSPEMRDKLRALMMSIKPKAGHKTFLGYSVFTNRIEYDAEGKAKIVTDSAQLQSWKKQLLYPEQFQETEFDVDKTLFDLRLESKGVPVGNFNKAGQSPSDKPNLVVYARLFKDGQQIGEMQMISIAGVNASSLPNAKIEMNQQQSKLFLDMLYEDLPRAEKSTVDQFKEEKDLRERGEKVDKKSIIPLEQFKATNTFFNYATKVHHVTRGVGEVAGKLPYLFYSASLSEEQINEAIGRKQTSNALLSGSATTSFELLEASLSELARMNIFGIALDGGNQVPVEDFLRQLYEDKKTGKDIKDNHKLKDKAAERFKNYILSKFKLKSEFLDAKALEELEDMKVSKMSAADKFLRKMVIEYMRPTGNFKHTSPDETTKTPKKGGTIIKGTGSSKDRKLGLHYNPMLAAIYEESISESKDSKAAQRIIAELSDSKGPFPRGVFKNSTTQPGSTTNMDVAFSQLSDKSAEESEFSVSNLLVPTMPVFQIEEKFIKDIIENGDMSSYDVSIKVNYNTETKAESEQAPPAENKAVRISVDATKDDEGHSTIDIAAGKTMTVQTIAGLVNTWFGNHADNMWLEEFSGYFRKHIIYDTLFKLHSATPEVVTQYQLHSVLTNLKKQFGERLKLTKTLFPTQENAAQLLRTNKPSDRGTYYDYIIAHEFDFLLRHYFSTGLSVVQGQYRYTTTDHVQGPVPDENDASHLLTGNDLVKMHFFATPIFTDPSLSNYRLPNKEDYYRIVRMVRDNDITSVEKARAFFRSDNPKTHIELLKHSMYLRFMAEAPTNVGGAPYNSLLSAAKTPVTQEMMDSHVTGMLSFLATGSESQYTRSTFTGLESKMSGRTVDIEPSRFRQDLEEGIRSTHRTIQEQRSPVRAKHYQKTDKKPERVSIIFPTGPKTMTTWEVRKVGADYYVNLPDSGNIDVAQFGWFLKAVGLGDVHKKFFGRVVGSAQMRASLFEIGKYLAQESTERPIFTGAHLTDWMASAEMISDIRQVEGAYGRLTLDGEYQELVTLGYPYVRSNQKIKELQQNPGVLRSNPAVTGELKITGYLIKDGFETKDGSRKRPNSKMTASEQLFYDFTELYLGSLSKFKITDTVQRAIFNPITFSDKGRDGVIQVEGEIIPRRAGVVDMNKIRSRAINSVSDYYQDISRSVINTWSTVLDETLNVKVGPVTPTDPPFVLQQRLGEINAIIAKLTPEQRRDLVNSELVSELMYTPQTGDVVDADGITRRYNMVGPIKANIVNYADPAKVSAMLYENYKNFIISFGNRYHFALGENLSDANLSLEEAKESYFWNWVWTTNSFTSMWLGPQEQYKSEQEYYDMIKRASQISTNRQRVITRSESWAPGQSIYEGRKMGRFSRTAIITDFSVPVSTISGGVVNQKVFDGASFFNVYGKLQMQYSYGNDAGFKVGANLKPIGNYLNPQTGHARYDKYASFEITDQMIDQGHPFIKKVNELMMKSVMFPKEIAIQGGTAKNLFELDALGRAAGMTPVEIYDIMVQNGVQDYFLREITFNSSVKNGVSHLNDFGNDMTYFQNYQGTLNYMERDNAEWGLILNASKESNDNDARIATQFISTFLQSTHTVEEAKDIMQAIARIGDAFRDKVNIDSAMDQVRKAIANKDEVGMLAQLINLKSGRIPTSNRVLMNAMHSTLSSWMSDESVRFRIFGGQQVIAPATGVFAVVDEVSPEGAVRTRLTKSGEMGRQLKGFNATREVGGKIESILDTPLWGQLVQATAKKTKNVKLANELRKQLRQELMSGGWTVQVPEIVISPTHFSAFGIPEGTNIEDVSEEMFAVIDAEKLHKRFDMSVMSEGDQLSYRTALEGNAATPEQLRAMRQPYIDAIVNTRRIGKEYAAKLESFNKTLNIIMGRIPATFFQSLTPLKVVGFAHGADNTAYVHPDILVLQGADHDIDKGNIMSFEADSQGNVVIPNTLDEAGMNPVHLKNFIVKRMIDGLNNPAVLIESTLPTNTDNIDDTIREMNLSPNKTDNMYNPISNNDSFVRGQSGKQNIGIHAAGLKTYSSVFHSAIQRGKTYSDYVPVSSALSREGQPFVLSGIDGGVEGLIMFGEAIQASVDNAKDPKLGLLGWDAANGGILNVLAMFGYSPRQIATFLGNPEIAAIYNKYRTGKEFFASNKDFYTSMTKLAAEWPNQTPEVKDLNYLLKIGADMRSLTTIVGINREVPNNMYGVSQMTKAFERMSGGITFYEYINSNEAKRQQMAIDYKGTSAFNPFEIFNDNFHLFSYMKSMQKLSELMYNSNMYTKIMDGAKMIDFYNEEEFKAYESMMYGLAVDAYIASKTDGKYVTMGGKLYDLTSVNSSENSKSRLEFMKDFPQHFKFLQTTRPEALTSMLTISMSSSNNPILKFEGNWKDYTVERKVKARALMQSLDKDVSIPQGDTTASNLLFYYSLIKDKGGVSSTSLTDVFDYENSEFSSFDQFVDTRFTTPYLSSPEELKNLYVYATGKWIKDKDQDKTRFMNSNREFIPYTNDITLNDAIDTTPPAPKDDWEPGRIGFRIGGKSKAFIDNEVKKALAYPVNRRMLERLADMLSRKYNIEAHVLSSSELAFRFGKEYGQLKGAAIDGRVYINADLATIDTPVHEFTHLWLEALRTENRSMYDQIHRLSLEHPYADRIREMYPELDDNGIAGEVFATLTGIHNSGKANSVLNRNFFQTMGHIFKDFMNWLNNLFLDIFGMKPSVNDSLLSIIDKVGESMLSTSTFNLSPYDKQVLKVLGVRTQAAEDTLSSIRDRLKVAGRFEKICA